MTVSDLRDRVLLAAACTHPLAVLLATTHWLFDLVTHFIEPAFAVSAIAALAWSRNRPRWPARLCLLIAAVQLASLTRLAGPPDPVPNPPPDRVLKLVFSNVLIDNTNFAPLVNWLEHEDPDVIALAEVSPECVRALDSIAARYPYRFSRPTGASGLALFAKQQPDSPCEIIFPTETAFPAARVVFSFDSFPRAVLWLVHPSSPVRREGKGNTNPEFDALIPRISRDTRSQPTIVVGDLNTTDASPYFHALIHKTRLRDSRAGLGRQPSWPVWSPYRLTLDHLLLPPQWSVVSRKLGPDVGSDHLPIVVTVAAAPGAPRQLD
jgi:endonuclease/exonuclease/phosphatase (EEP) superfamily protein YafD